jgi:hypothetical protein
VALVRSITPCVKQRQRVHEETPCESSVVTDDHGKRYLQVDTYGSGTRKFKGKVSQSIQFDEAAAHALRQLIDETFPRLSRR